MVVVRLSFVYAVVVIEDRGTVRINVVVKEEGICTDKHKGGIEELSRVGKPIVWQNVVVEWGE